VRLAVAFNLRYIVIMLRFSFLLLGAGLASFGVAAPMAWVLNTNTTLDVVNAATNADIPYGNTPWTSYSLARSPSGQLYSADPLGVIFDVTGPPIPVGPTGYTQIADLDWASNGLWGFDNATSDLFFFDLGLLSVTYSANITLPGSGTITGVAHEASTGDIYLCGNNGLNNDKLLRIANSTTTAVLVGSMANGDAFSYFSDIDFDASGTLYAVSWFHRYFYTVSTTTGATTFVSAGPHRDVTAMALNPVPEPASFAVLGLGVLALRRRRR